MYCQFEIKNISTNNKIRTFDLRSSYRSNAESVYTMIGLRISQCIIQEIVNCIIIS